MLEREPKPAREEPWRRLAGLHTVRGRKALAVARALWIAREEYAREEDVAPGRLVPDRALVAAVIANPKSKQDLGALKEFTGRASRSQLDRWWAAIEAGRAVDRAAARTVHRRRHAASAARVGRPQPGGRRAAEGGAPGRGAPCRGAPHADGEPADARTAAPGRLVSPAAADRGIRRRGTVRARGAPVADCADCTGDRRCLCRFRASRVGGAGARFVGFRHPIPAALRPLLGWRHPYFWRQSGRDLGRLLRRWNAHPLRARRREGHVLEHPSGRPRRQGDDRTHGAQPGRSEGPHRRRRDRRDVADRRPGAHPRPQRRDPGGTPPDRPGLRDRPHVRGRHDERHDDGRLDRRRHVRRRPRRRRRAHGPPPDRRQRRPQPAVRRGEDGRPGRAQHGRHRRAHLRPLPAPDQGALGPLRHAQPAQGAGRVRRRQDPARPGPRRDQGRRRRVGARHRGRRPPSPDDDGRPRGAEDALPPARARHGGHVVAAHRRGDDVAAGRRRARSRSSASHPR